MGDTNLSCAAMGKAVAGNDAVNEGDSSGSVPR